MMTRFVTGNGPLLVLLHGVGLDHTMWRGLAAHLEQTHTVLAYDLLGHGVAPPLEDPATLAQFTGQLWREADALDHDTFSLCGFSMGAMIAQHAARERPGRISDLILMCGVHRRSAAERERVAARLHQAEQDGPTSNIESALTRWFTEPFRQARPEVIDAVRQRLERNDPVEFLKAYRMFATADGDLADFAHEISCRTLVTTGEHDTGSTPAMMRTLAGDIPNAKAHLLEGLAHMAPVEAPATVASVMTRFLADDPAASS